MKTSEPLTVMTLFGLLKLVSPSAVYQASFKWDYSRNGPRSWPAVYPDCSKEQQSPINIDTKGAWYYSRLTALEWNGYETIPRNTHWEMWNTGHAVRIEVQGGYALSDGGLPGVYKIAYMDLHWGGEDTRGSEHTMNGKAYAMEMQLVHYKVEYGSVGKASQYDDGLVILSFLFEPVKHNNLALAQFIDHLKNITHKGDHVTLRPVPLLSVLPPDLNNYYRYHGSLTSPPCSQTVSWTVFKERVEISERQLKKLRSTIKSNNALEQDVPLVDNFRSLQPLNSRTVYSSDPEDATLLSSPLGSPVSITLAVCLGFIIMFLVVR